MEKTSMKNLIADYREIGLSSTDNELSNHLEGFHMSINAFKVADLLLAYPTLNSAALENKAVKMCFYTRDSKCYDGFVDLNELEIIFSKGILEKVDRENVDRKINCGFMDVTVYETENNNLKSLKIFNHYDSDEAEQGLHYLRFIITTKHNDCYCDKIETSGLGKCINLAKT